MAEQIIRHAHLIGIGGINMSAVAKLLLSAGVQVSGSDVADSEIVQELTRKGVTIMLGHAALNVPLETDIIIYSSAVPEFNPERSEGRKRRLRQLTNFEFLGEWSADKRTILVTGTHGKSTTTAIVGLLLEAQQLDPTVFVGSRVAAFPEGNLRIGQSNLAVIEGDEFAKHFLHFSPTMLLINNIELDHPDIFPDLAALLETFRTLLSQVRDKGTIIANADDPNVSTLLGQERSQLEARGIRIRTFGFASHADFRISDVSVRSGEQIFTLSDAGGSLGAFTLRLPGRMNIMNAAAAATVALELGVDVSRMKDVLKSFPGIWRRFEKIGERDGILVVSDYGHHPTAVRLTLEAARSFYPGRRVVLCFQPHHRIRTRELFADFVPSFDAADALVLSEIYDVKGREDTHDAPVSSRDLREAVLRHDVDRTRQREVEYAADPTAALETLRRWKRNGDVLMVMGAGDIYRIAEKLLE